MKPYKTKPIQVPRFEEAAGFYTSAKRSEMMSRIRGKNTKPEILLRKELWKHGFRYRINVKKIPGRPDIFISKYKLAIFVDGDFWHGRDWQVKKKMIKSNRGFWIPKIERNMQRDHEVNTKLEDLGLTVIRFWEGFVISDIASCVKTVEAYAHTEFHLRDNFDAPNDFSNFT
ncbi:MAG: very short patch repair endonuclease [Cyclobacteriaceae bacterium]